MKRKESKTSLLGQTTPCPHCQHENRIQAQACEQCGQPLDGDSLEGTRPKSHWKPSYFGPTSTLVIIVRGGDKPIITRPDGKLMIGRYDAIGDFAPDIDLDPYEATRKGVSRQHAVIHIQDDALMLADLGSANGTFLNGQRLQAHQPYPLRDGDEVRLGLLVMQISFRHNAPGS